MPATNYIWDGDNILMEKDDIGQTTAEYTYNPKPHGELISQRHKVGMSWQTRYHEFDAIGSTRALTDETGVVTDTYQDDAWGNQISVTGTSENPFRWIGKLGYYWDQELGSYYVRERTYEALIARWLSRDPLMFSTVNASLRRYVASPNFYEYCYSSPVTNVDPSGLFDGPMEWEHLRNMTPQNKQAELASRISEIRNMHSQYRYYSPANLRQFFDLMEWVVKYQVSGAYEYSTANYRAAASYKVMSNSMQFPTTIGAVSDAVLLHELVHALDDSQDWYITKWSDGGVESEALAYAAEYMIRATFKLRQFEDRISSGARFMDCQTITKEWREAWWLMGNPAAFGFIADSGVSVRRLRSGDFKDARLKLWLRFSCEELRKVYQERLTRQKNVRAAFAKSETQLPDPCSCYLPCEGLDAEFR